MAGPVDEHSVAANPPATGARPSSTTTTVSALAAVTPTPDILRRSTTFDPDHPPDTAALASNAPDWSLVHFDVACARCGHDLHGQSEPVCPACGLEFDWAQAVPLEELTCAHCGYHLYGLSETRCPECGESFTWEAALADYHLRCKPWFEYQWTKTPLRSFARTVTYAVRPWRLWREMSIHDPPRVGSLMVLWLASAALMIGVPVVQSILFTQIIGMLSTPTIHFIKFFDPFRPAFGMRFALLGLLFLAVWNGTILLILLTMRWSLAKCKGNRSQQFSLSPPPTSTLV